MSESKRAAGRRAAEFVETGQNVGLGTGSTVFFTLERLGERIREDGLEIRGVPTSIDTETKARDLGIPLATLDEIERIDVTIDGADEIDSHFAMIKGGGGALLREKVVASVSDHVVIVVGPDKVVDRLGSTFHLPVEIVPFARGAVERAIRALGGEPTVRAWGGEVVTTDNGNQILDVHNLKILDAVSLESEINQIVGVVTVGLFAARPADLLLVGGASGVREMTR